MKNKIKTLLREALIKGILIKEDVDEFEQILSDMPYEIYSMIRMHKQIRFKLMPKVQYHKALKEFMQYGKFVRFPDKIIFDWKDLLLENIAKLYTINAINGHDTHFPSSEFLDVFDYNDETGEHDGEYSTWLKAKGLEPKKYQYDWNEHSEFLDTVYNYDDYLPKFSNGHHMISDYGTEPLMKLGYEMARQEKPEEIIVTINRILDVAHQRSDLAEIFIEGGSASLDYISNS